MAADAGVGQAERAHPALEPLAQQLIKSAEMRRLHARSRASRLMSKLIYRAVDVAKPLQKAFRGKR